MNYFEFYNIEPSFVVQSGELKRIFYQNSKKYHPDFHTLADETKQAEALDMATLNNEAYKTLSDPDKRMKYLLETKGILAEEGSNKLPQEFLMDMMDINEELMELESDYDADKHQQIKLEVKNIENQLFAEINPILCRWSEDKNMAGDLSLAKDYFLKKRYLLRIVENLENL